MMKKDAFKKYSGGIDTLRRKKEFITFIIMVIVLFGGGIFLGYYIWGIDKKHKPDYKKYLKDTIVYLQKIEDNNEVLKAETKSLKADVGILKKSVTEKENTLAATSKRLEEKLAVLEKENIALKQSISEKETELTDAEALKKKFEELQEKFNVLKEQTTQEKAAGEQSVEKVPVSPPVKEKEAVAETPDTMKEFGDTESEQEKIKTSGEKTTPQENNATEEKTGEE